MPIKITTTDFITEINMKAVVSYYNTYLIITGKDITFNIELVEYKNATKPNYGFRIKLKNPNYKYTNGEYKHMRWENKTLASLFNFPPFLPEEEYLLYKFMRFTIGKEHVTYYDTYEKAIVDSPNFNRSTLVQIQTSNPVMKDTISQLGQICRREWF